MTLVAKCKNTHCGMPIAPEDGAEYCSAHQVEKLRPVNVDLTQGFRQMVKEDQKRNLPGLTAMERIDALEQEVADLKFANGRLVELVERTRADYRELTERLTAKVLAQLAAQGDK